RAFLDLSREQTGRAEVEHDFVAGLFFVRGGFLLQRIGETRGGEHGDFRRADASDGERESGKYARERTKNFLHSHRVDDGQIVGVTGEQTFSEETTLERR